jgi:xanthine dehydrogenase accessory factor
MLFPNIICIVRGGGDLASGVIYRLRRAGFPVGVLELARPRVVRRLAAYAEAVYAGEVIIAGLTARRTSPDDMAKMLAAGLSEIIPVVIDPQAESIGSLRPAVVVDARMTKLGAGAQLEQASLVVGLGPGFVVGRHCHVVVETNRGPDLGRVMWQGSAQADTGQPEAVLGYVNERVLRAPANGRFRALGPIGSSVQKGQVLAEVAGAPILAPFDGVVRGLIHDDLEVAVNEKVGDLDPRGRADICFKISDKSLAVGGGVLEAVLTWMGRPGEGG